MARYLKTANQANSLIKKILNSPYLDSLSESEKNELTVDLGYIYNLGIRTAPRAVHSTVRLNAVKEALFQLNVFVDMKKVTDTKTGFTFNALTLKKADSIVSDDNSED